MYGQQQQQPPWDTGPFRSVNAPISHDGYDVSNSLDSRPTWHKCMRGWQSHNLGDRMTLLDITKVIASDPANARGGYWDSRGDIHGADEYMSMEYQALMYRIRQGLQRSATWLEGDCAVYSEILLPGALAMGSFRTALSAKVVRGLEHEGVECVVSGDLDALRITVSAKIK